MHPRSLLRRFGGTLLLFTATAVLFGCGSGDGPKRIPGTPQAPATLNGVLLDSPVSGVSWQTSGGDSGVTNVLGEFSYLQGDSVTFSVGDIVLGTAPGAPFITMVELTNSLDPTTPAALNQLIFLQSLDADGDPSNGITISAATRTAAAGMSLDFSSPDFTNDLAAIIETLTEPGRQIVSAGDALAHFYTTYQQLGGTETFNFLFPGFPAVSGSGPAFELIFNDEFDSGTAPDPAKWTAETGYGPNNDGWGNNEWQLYTDSPDNVRVENGNLVISALCPAKPCGVRDGTVTSARINTLGKFSFKFGKIIARIKPPVGKGAWPAFWSLGANFPVIGWPRSGEMDFMEVHQAFSNERTTHSAMHWCDETIQAPAVCSFPDGWVLFTQNRDTGMPLDDDFHIWEVDWTPERVVVSIDGVQYFSRTIDPATMEEFLREFFLILNVAMGGTLGSDNQPPDGTEVFPQTMLVDYVRVFQLVDEGPPEDVVIDFENAPETYDFGPGGGFEGGTSAVIPNPVPGGINTSRQVARMLKFAGAVFAGSKLTLDTPIELTSGGTFRLKVWSQRQVRVLLKLEGPVESEVEVTHGGSGWEELSFDFPNFSGTIEGITFIFDLGVVGDAENDPDNWTFYYDDLVIPVGSGGGGSGGSGGSGGGGGGGEVGTLITDFEGPPESFDFGPDGGFEGGAAAVIPNPVPGGINTSAQVGRMLKFNGAVFAGATWMLPTPLEVQPGSSFTMKVWSPRPVRVLFKLESTSPVEVEVAHNGTGWEELTFDFGDASGTFTGITLIFDLGVVGDANNDPDNWTFYFDDIRLIAAGEGGGSGGGAAGDLIADFEGNPGAFDFGVEGGFGGGIASVVANPVPEGINTSAQVARMLKFAGEVFAGTTLNLPSGLDVPPGSAFTMKVWSPREVRVLFKLEGPTPAEVEVTHSGSGWEELLFDFSGITGSFTGITVIFDLGVVGAAATDPANWTFYFDDITRIDAQSSGGSGGLFIDFEATPASYDFGPGGGFEGGASAVIANPVPGGINTSAQVARMLKFAGAVFAGSTLMLPDPIDVPPNSLFRMKVWSPRPVRVLFKLESAAPVEVEMPHSGSGWEELSFDFGSAAGTFDGITLIFDLGVAGDAENDPANWTFYFDDIELVTPGG